MTTEQLQDLARFEESPHFTPRHKLVLRLASAMSATPATVSEALFAELAREFNEAALVELVAAIAWENYRARFNRVFDIGSEGYSEEQFCPMPER